MKFRTCAALSMTLAALTIASAQDKPDKPNQKASKTAAKQLSRLIEDKSFYRDQRSENRIIDVEIDDCRMSFKTKKVFIAPRRENFLSNADAANEDNSLYKNFSQAGIVNYSFALKDLDENSFRALPVLSNINRAEPQPARQVAFLEESMVRLMVSTNFDKKSVAINITKKFGFASEVSLTVDKKAAEEVKDGLGEIIKACRDRE